MADLLLEELGGYKSEHRAQGPLLSYLSGCLGTDPHVVVGVPDPGISAVYTVGCDRGLWVGHGWVTATRRLGEGVQAAQDMLMDWRALKLEREV